MKSPTNESFNKLHLIIHSLNLKTYEKRTAKPYSFLVIDTTLAKDNPLCFK